MNINCTVIIQICNFFLAWLLLEKILLRSLLQKLTLKKRYESELCASIEKMKQSIAQLEQDHTEQWQKFNKYCLHNIPTFKIFNSFPTPTFNLIEKEVDADSVDALCKDYTSRITHWFRETQ